MTTIPKVDAPPSTAVEAPVEREFTIRSRSQTQQALRRFLHNKLAVGALVVYVIVLLIAFVGPIFYAFTFEEQDGAALSASPGTNGHPLGTDDIGRDLLALMMRGIQRSTYISLIFVVIAGALGVLIGAVAGYFGKGVDSVLMRLVDIILTVPILVFIIVVAANFPESRSPLGIALFIALLGWMDLARIVRSQFLSLREREYVEAAHALGASNRRIILKHLIPNSLGQIIVWATLGTAIAVITEAALSFLGYGVQGSDTSLGRLVADGAAAAESRPWLFYFPGLAILIIVMCINLIGDGIRDAFDPSANRVRA
ncbi:MAG TPA: ABC transporter permease [Actinoplanes sp.]|nr:ABC transporter permease [Actinoplanes sp.]